MLLMEHCKDVDQRNPFAKSNDNSWHGSVQSSSSKQSRNSQGTAEEPKPVERARALPEAVTSEVLCSVPPDAQTCSASHLSIPVDGANSVTFAGAFKASQPGAAHEYLRSLAHNVKRSANLRRTCNILRAAIDELDPPEGCIGSVGVVCEGFLSFSVLGRGLVALSHEDTEGSKTELLAGLERPGHTEAKDESSASLDQPRRRNPSAGFGSIIPVDRSSLSLSPQNPAIVSGECRLTDSHRFLLLGAGPIEQAVTADEAIGFIERAGPLPSHSGKAASLLVSECHRIMTAQKLEDSHMAVAVLHFQPQAATASRSPSSNSNLFKQLASPLREQQSMPSLQPSPSGRKVHFLQPCTLGESDVPPSSEATAFAEAATLAPSPDSRSSSWEAHLGLLGSLADSSGLLSRGSVLSGPDMSIPEDKRLPSGALALQLPPPLLPPIRKAYPSNHQLSQCPSITPDMLSSPSPARKAKIGRAASFNSPEGLWPLPPQALVRHSSGNDFGSRCRSGEEGRVRGGLPRNASTLSVSETQPSLSPSTSFVTTPSSSRRQSADDERPEEARNGSENPAELSVGAQIQNGLQVGQGSEALDPWGGKSDRRGRKAHGQSQALRLLQGSVGSTVSGLGPKTSSAPATLNSSLSLSLSQPPTQPLSRLLSSSTESVVQSVFSGSSSGSCRPVVRVPYIEDSPHSFSNLASPSRDRENRYPSATTPSERSSVPSEPGNPLLRSPPPNPFRQAFNDLTAQRYTSQAYPSPMVGHPIPNQSKGKMANIASWPEIDSAALGQGLLKSASTESRQHSGMLFPAGSLTQDMQTSLADSVDSLKLKSEA